MSRVLLSSWKARRSPRQKPGAWPASRLASGRGRSEEPAAAGPPPARAALHLGEGGGEGVQRRRPGGAPELNLPPREQLAGPPGQVLAAARPACLRFPGPPT